MKYCLDVINRTQTQQDHPHGVCWAAATAQHQPLVRFLQLDKQTLEAEEHTHATSELTQG